jgi:hypothetical protein
VQQTPRACLVLPEVREAALYGPSGHETGRWRIADRLDGLESHDDDEGAVRAPQLRQKPRLAVLRQTGLVVNVDVDDDVG